MSEGVRRPRLLLTLRLLAAIPGGYAFSAVWVAALGGLLAYAGMLRSDAVVLAATLGYLFFLVFLVWCFAQRSVARIWTVTLVGSALCAGTLVVLNLGR